jgi:signal transduction histidine kinase/ligand-binding sensor domain-containing protein
MRRLIGVFAVLAASLLQAIELRAVDLRNVLTDYTLTSFSRKDGLVGPVWAVAQDANGFLWLGTDSGLVRFDGVRFSSWEGLGGQPLPRLPIRSLYIAPTGTLWVGYGGGGGLARIDNRLVTTFVASEGVESMGPVTSINEDRSGTIWASSGTGLFRLKDNKWEHIGAADGLPDDSAVNAFIDREDRLWVSSFDGLYKRDHAGHGRFERIEPSYDPQRTLGLSQDADGRIWVTDSLVGFRALGDGPPLRGADAGRGYRLLHDRDGNLWVATIGQGLWRARYQSAARNALTVERATVLTGLSSDAVRTVFEDRDGNIWAGTTDGVDRLVPHRVTPLANLGIVNSIDATIDGRMWAGTVDALIPFSLGDNGWQPSELHVPVRGATVIRAASTGGLWAITTNALYRVQGASVTPIPLPRAPHARSIEALATDTAGEAWIVTSGGEVLRTDGGVLKLRDQIPELRGVRTNAALVDQHGQLWVSYAGNRIGVIGEPGQFRTFDDKGVGSGQHYDLYEDGAGVIWISGADGMIRFTGDRFESAGRANGLPAGGVYSIAQDDRKDFWLSTPTGIITLDPAEFDRAVKSPDYVMRFRIYDTSDGLAGYPVLLGDRNAVRAEDGTLWFVSSRGISVANPRTLGNVRPEPLVAIDEALANDVRVEGNDLRPGTSKLQIYYTAPELSSPLKTRFRYRLEGYDADWVDAGTRREALYTNLSPGDYTFRVSVSQDDGRWSETEATWSFVLHPRFYQTWWFGALAVASLAAITWGSWQIRIRQIRRQFSLVLSERVRLSRELHDTLLQSLVGVALEFDAVSKSLESSPVTARQRVIKIREQVEEYIRDARRSIWSLRSPALETGDLIEALRDTVARAAGGHDVSVTFEQEGEPRRLSSNIEHQLLRIGQESLLNAVRHSGAQTISVRLRYDPGSIMLIVADNGHGFVAGRSPEGTTDHYGLTTMAERAQQAGGRLTISSEPGKGTTVEAVVPTGSDEGSNRSGTD